MRHLKDTTEAYGAISRAFHWGMAALFLLQFLSAAAHYALPRENFFRETLWSYHTDLGILLFLLVALRGIWGITQISRRPRDENALGVAAKLGHLALYGLMIIVPAVRIIDAAGGTRGLSVLGLELVAPRDVAIAWTQSLAEWHGEIGWFLAFVILGHIIMATVVHPLFLRDNALSRMI